MILTGTIPKAADRVFYGLGTINSIRIFGDDPLEAVQEAEGRVAEIENRMSVFKQDSDIGLLNRKSGTGFQKLHRDTFGLLEKSVWFGNFTHGAFDITSRPLSELWGINRRGSFVPSEAAIQRLLPLVDYKSLRLDPEISGAFLGKAGQSIDLGGIAKGYAADEVRRILLEHGIRNAMVNLGGNVVAVGNRPDGSPWRVGIQNPLEPTGTYLGILTVSDSSVVTSGSNERFFIKDGVRYHHILDPRTGRPAQSSLLSVTVVCPCSADADALATACFVLGVEKSLPLLEQADAQAVFLSDDLTVRVTEGMQNQFRLNSGERVILL